MSDQKNIDKLFREKFKDFEAAPNPQIWDNIASELGEEKKKRRILPLFYRIGAIAAILILFVTIGISVFNDDGQNTDPTVSETNTTNNASDTKDNNHEKLGKEQDASSDKNLNPSEKDIPTQNEAITNTNATESEESVTNNNVINTNNELQVTETDSKQNVQKNTTQKRVVNTNAVANTSTETQKNTSAYKNAVTQHTTSNEKTNTSTNIQNKKDVTATQTTMNSIANASSSNKTITQDTKGVIAQNTTVNKGVSNTKNTDNKNAVSENTVVNTTSSNTTAITKRNETNAVIDSIADTAVAATETSDEVKKSILDVINELKDIEDDSDVEETAKKSRWAITPNFAPVYYNSISEGSPIDSLFIDNSKEGDLNVSYGLNVSYAVNDRLSVRSGINRVNYSYSTKDISYFPTFDDNNIKTIAFSNNTANISLRDRQTATASSDFPTLVDGIETPSIQQARIDGSLNQRMSYIEVPVEVEYKLIDKKIGVNIIGGMSTLFLSDNKVLLESPNLTAILGESTNVNNVSFSTNVGLGIDYEVSKNVEINIEPMLKYQLNTFSRDAGNFRPYSLGVYSGINFKF